jgi:hypothetical protein
MRFALSAVPYLWLPGFQVDIAALPPDPDEPHTASASTREIRGQPSLPSPRHTPLCEDGSPNFPGGFIQL